MRVLVVNAGSSSLKLAVLDGDREVAATTVERWEGEEHLEPISSFVAGVDGSRGGRAPDRARRPPVDRVGAHR